MKQIKIGITGIGSFFHCFTELFQGRLCVSSVAFAGMVPERMEEAGKKYGVSEFYESHEALCRSDVDAVGKVNFRKYESPN
jgi:predicted dehydrogenase